MRFLTFTLLLGTLLLSNAAHAQLFKPRVKKFYQKAYQAYGKNDYVKSLELAKEALQADSTHQNTLILLTDIYNITGRPKKEASIYFRILALDSQDLRSHMNLADLYLKNGEYDLAVKKYRYLKNSDWLPERYNKLVANNLQKSIAGKKLKDNPRPFSIQKLRAPINSIHDEYWPFLTPDKEKMLFTRTKIIDDKGKPIKRREENIQLVVKSGKASQWKKGRDFPVYINSKENEGAISMTQDGKTLFFTRCVTTQGRRGDCNIFRSHLMKNGRWSLPEMLPVPINTPFKETQPSISYNGKVLFFSSNRPGGLGGMDIWVSRMNKDSIWAEPRNLGSRFNTPQNEESPFIHLDNQSLYFSSNGWPGMGRGDFYIGKLNNRKSSAINMGYPLNTNEKQLGIFIEMDGKTGYYASIDSTGETGLDIYKFKLPDSVKPDSVVKIEGYVYHSETKKPLEESSVIVKDIFRNEEILDYSSTAEGRFAFGLPQRTGFGILTMKQGFVPNSINVSADSVAKYQSLEIFLKPIKTNASFTLENVFFETDSSSIKSESLPEIELLAEFLKQHPKVFIEVGGHTDNSGDKDYNLELSLKRAESVKENLKKFLDTEMVTNRVSTKGYGAEKPIATNETEIGKQLNRRTEITIIKG